MMYTKVYFLLLGLVAKAALAELTYTVTATHNGKPVKASELVLERTEPGLHRLNTTTRQNMRGAHARQGNGYVYSTNWCGAVQNSPSSNPITSVHAFFQVPTLTPRTGVTAFPQYVAPWVGIDGATYFGALIQSGTTSEIDADGVQTNWAWLEWVPDAAYNIPNFLIETGDWMEITVSASNATEGLIHIVNYSKNFSYTITLNNGTPLERVDADWIIEDPQTGSGQVPFAHFSETWFEECNAETLNGPALGIDGSIMYYMDNDRCKSSEYDNTNFYVHPPP